MDIKPPIAPYICSYTNVISVAIETLMSAKQAINDKLQGSVAIYFRCGGVVNNQIRKSLLLSVSVIFLNRKIFGKVISKNVIVSYTFFVLWQCVGQFGFVRVD